MLMDYKGSVTVKIDGIAASAASVIAMAGAKVYVSPVSMLMIHNPMTVAMGNAADMEKAIEMLSSVKDSIINAYEIKTGLSRARLSHLMDAETWMDANKAVELGFADEILSRPKLAAPQKEEDEEDTSTGPEKPDEEEEKQEETKKASMLFSRKALEAEFMNKLRRLTEQKPAVPDSAERPVKDIMARLDTIKKFM
jgi:ATP-dependent Clp protease protease subunit